MSLEQVASMLGFLEGQPELALGRISRSKEGRSLAKRLWQECADMLNSISSDCSQKTAEQWRLYYNEYKYRLIKKVKKEKQSRSATGGGPPSFFKLTPLEERLLAILGNDIGEPLPGVRHNPLITHIENDGGSTSNNDGLNVVVEETENLNWVEEAVNVNRFAPIEYELEVTHLGAQQPIGSQVTLSSHEDVHEIHNPEPIGSPANLSSQGGEQSRPTARRRRRRRPIPELDADPMRRATETLEALESQSAQAAIQQAQASLKQAEATLKQAEATLKQAEATAEQAQAINRLAAAMESLTERLQYP